MGVLRMNIVKTIEEFEQNYAWVDQHYPQLRANYPDQYVAVLDGKVVDSGPDAKTLSQRLRQAYGERERNIAVRYISTKDFEMVL